MYFKDLFSSCKGKAASENDLEVTYYNDDNITEVLQPLLVQPHNTWVSYHLPQPAAVTKVQIRAVGNVSLALCGVSVLGGKSNETAKIHQHDFARVYAKQDIAEVRQKNCRLSSMT